MNLNSSSAEPAASAATADSTLRRAGRSGLIALLVGFVGFLLWAAWAPLDEGAYSRAMVVIDTKRKPVQHPAGGIIESVRVGEGTVVREGQVIMTLDPAIARANHEAVRQRYLSLRAVHSRLLAEQG
ncbi:MAG: biotin/lipoyl-binding protein, partial [Burkholderiales bacterium]